MKILTLSTYDIRGGAAIAAFRIVKGLQSTGHESLMLVNQKFSDDNFVLANDSFIRKADRALKKQLSTFEARATAKDLNVLFSDARYGALGLVHKIREIAPDVIHIHWVQRGFLSLPQIAELAKLNIPIVWTLHDSWLFTGGCHVPAQGCRRFENSCGKCPLLKSTHEHDLSLRIWMKKKEIFDSIDFTVTTPSKWLMHEVKSSSLLREKKISVIHNTIEPQNQISRNDACKTLHLDPKKKYILFGGMFCTKSPVKGYNLLQSALKSQNFPSNTELLIFGNDEEIQPNAFNIPVHTFGVVRDSAIKQSLFACASVTVVPSLSETFSLMTLESYAQGTPVVAFRTAALPEIVKHGKTGYLADAFDARQFGELTLRVVSNNSSKMRQNSLQSYLGDYSIESQTQSFIQVYQQLMA